MSENTPIRKHLGTAGTTLTVADVKAFTTGDTAEKVPEDTTVVGTRQEPNVESILSLDPDLVIIESTSHDDKIVGQLEKQGIPVTAIAGTDDPESEDYVELLEKNDIWANLPAVRDNRTFAFPTGVWTFVGPRSVEQALNAYGDAVTKRPVPAPR